MTPFFARSQRSTSATSHILAVLSLFLCTLSILSPALARASAPPHVKLAVQKYELPNGLDVILCKNDRLPHGGGERLVSRRPRERGVGPHGIRAPLRAHDVQGLEARAGRPALDVPPDLRAHRS
jgi:hypothetical protein